jgi:MFS family permease
MTANGLTGTQAAETSFPLGGPPADRPPVPGARLALALLLGINLFNYIDRTVLSANLASIEKQLLPPNDPDNGSWLGLLALAFILSYMIFAPLFGWLADRVPRWRLIGLGVLLWTLASGASGLAGTFGPGGPASGLAVSALVGTFAFLLVTRCFVGVGEAAYGPVAPAVISDLFPIKVRGSVLAWFYVAIPVGGALGYALGGWRGWPAAFYWVVPPGIALGVLCFFMPEPPTGQTDLAEGATLRRVRLADYLILLRTPSYVLDSLGMAALTFAIGGISHWMVYYIEVTRGQPDPVRINLIFGAIVVVSGLGATILGGLAGDALRGRFPGSYFLVSGAAMLLGFPAFLAVLYVPFPWTWVFIFLACFCLFFNTGPTNTILANVTHPSLRAPAFAVNIFVIHVLGDAISPWVIGKVAGVYSTSGKLNMHAGFLAVSCVILVGGVLWLWGARYLERDTALAVGRFTD